MFVLSLSIPSIRIDVILKELFLSYLFLFILELHGLRELHEEWYFKQHMDRDFTQVRNHRYLKSIVIFLHFSGLVKM